MKKFAAIAALLTAAICLAQEPKPQMDDAEQKALQSALAETANSPMEIARTLEKHLEKYPDSPQKPDLLRALMKSAMDANDRERILRWGEQLLAIEPNQPLVLERVAQVLLEGDGEDKQRAARALKYAQKFEEILRSLEKEGPSSRRNRAAILEEMDRALARALAMQARATGKLGKTDEAIALAQRGWERYPTAAGARELAHWLERAGRNMDAVKRYAEAFTMADAKNTPAARAADRRRMSELYRKDKQTEAGLGDLVLEAYDRTVGLAAQQTETRLRRDPNADADAPMEFTLTALEGPPLKLSSLLGKVVVMDFWATWCGPCRAQHPLYKKVEERFKGRDDVVFVYINTDEDDSAVRPFLEANGWDKKVFFEDGLASLLRVSSIPTTIIVDKTGEIFTRMNGYVPDRFVDQLTGRINDALKKGAGE